jgi:hypothetical protein
MCPVALWIERRPGDKKKAGYMEVHEREVEMRAAGLKQEFRKYWSAAEVRCERFYYKRVWNRRFWVPGEGYVWHRYVGQDPNDPDVQLWERVPEPEPKKVRGPVYLNGAAPNGAAPVVPPPVAKPRPKRRKTKKASEAVQWAYHVKNLLARSKVCNARGN